MAIGWLTVLKWVPWGDVISNAPRVAEGAKKLWSTVAKKPPAAMPAMKSPPEQAPDAVSIAQMRVQLDAALFEISDLHQQMLASSELIQALAEQNTHLIKRVEVNRLSVLWLAGIMLALGMVGVINLVFMFDR